MRHTLPHAPVRRARLGARIILGLSACIGVGLLVRVAAQDAPAAEQSAEPDCRSCGLQFEMVLAKSSFEVGEPITVTTRLLNTSDAPVDIVTSSEVTGRNDGYLFTITDERGQMLPDPGVRSASLMNNLVSVTTIQPKAEHVRDLTLNYRVPPLRPGRYLVRGVFTVRSHVRPEHPDGMRLPFQVVATPSSRLRQRVSALKSTMDRDGRAEDVAPLLGFTGQPAALSLLVDLFYTADDRTQAVAADALLFFERPRVRRALFDAIRARGPRDWMVGMLLGDSDVDRRDLRKSLLPWLTHVDADARAAAVEGLRLMNLPPDPALFKSLAAKAGDPVAAVRRHAAAAVGAYANAAALETLVALVRDADIEVSEQAAIGVGWIAESAPIASATRSDAIAVLRAVERAGGRAGQQAHYWLARIGEP